MPTNGMTIDGLNTVSALTAQDKVPVWDNESSGEPTRKITAQNMANSVKTLGNLVNTTEMNTAITQSTAGSKTIVGAYTSTVKLPEISIIGFLVHDFGGTASVYALYGSRCDLIAGAGGITTDGNTSGQTLTFQREGTNRILFIYK